MLTQSLSVENSSRTYASLRRFFAITLIFSFGGANLISAEETFDTDTSVSVESVLPPAFFSSGAYEFNEYAIQENLFYRFTVTTQYGPARISSIAMLRRRLGEITKLDEIQRQSPGEKSSDQFVTYGEEDVFSDALGTAWRIRRPGGEGETASNKPNALADSLVYEDDFPSIQWRTAAARTGIDPYSSFPPVQATLRELSKTLGGNHFPKAVSPTPAYQVFEPRYPVDENFEFQMATKIKNSTVAELRDEVVRLLDELDVDRKSRAEFMNNRAYIESDRYRLAKLLLSVDELVGKNLLVASASTAETEVDALAFLNYVRLLSAYNTRVAPLTTVIGVTRYPALISSEGAGLLALPIDYLPWNERTSTLAGELAKLRDELSLKEFTVLLLGKPTDRARLEIEKLNVKLIDGLSL